MMNLYDLLEKYTWEGVKGYHFQFHRKRVASGQSIYLPSEWQQLDSELIASKCFAHPIVRNAWPQSTSRTAPSSRRFSELPIRESPFANSYCTTERRPIAPPNYPTSGPGSSTAPLAINVQACRNWNYRECQNAQCRYHHVCILCGSSHEPSQCNQNPNALSVSHRGGFRKR